MKLKPICFIIMIILFCIILCGCDAERNQLIMGFFSTDTPIPPTSTITPSPTSTSTPIPTPLPEYRIETAETFLLSGDYDKAWQEFERTLLGNPQEEYYAAAILGEARIEYERGNYDNCLSIISTGLPKITKNENQSLLWFQSADCNQKLEKYTEEIDSLQKYTELRPETSIISEIYERQGDAYFALGRYTEAIEKYISVINDPGSNNFNAVRIKLADSYYAEEDYSNALQTWLDILEVSTDDQQKARVYYLMGETYLQLGSKEQAFSRFQDAVNNYPRTYDSYASLLILLDNDQPVNEFQRGLVNYYMNQYALASEAFFRYIKDDPNHDGSAFYYIGLCQMYMAEYDEAISSFQRIIDDYPNNRFYASAWDEKAYIQWSQFERYEPAAQTLLSYAEKHPDQPDAANFIYEAGRILERGDHLTEAALQWERLIDEYPLYENSSLALFLAGICRYRIENYDAALATFNRLLLLSTKPEDLARAHFWTAKVYSKKGETEAAERYYKLASADDPSNYYSERASDILSGREHLKFSADFSFEINLQQERQVADQWMRITFNLDEQTDLENPVELSINNNYKMANELWSLGYYQDSMNLFETVRLEYAADPVNSYRLLNRLVEIGAWRTAVYTSRQVLTIAGLIEDVRTLSAPNYFNHIRYGVWFSDIVASAYETHAIHPFILYGLMRQESMYDPWITSSAGAQGLMQIMPATGLEIAKNLHWPPEYSDSDLNRALIAINFSGYYLSKQFNYFNRDYFYMLASYNAGPGNTAGWVDLADDDPDLFMEIIRFEETRTYIKHVYEFSKMYERLYAK